MAAGTGVDVRCPIAMRITRRVGAIEKAMKYLGMALVAFALCHAGQAMAADADTWPELEKALGNQPVKVGASKQVARFYKLPPRWCPKIPVEEYRYFVTTVRFEPTRTLEMDILIGRLPAGFDAYGPLVAAAKESPDELTLRGCLMPKSGLSLLQVGRFVFLFPTVCADIYPYKKSLPIVIDALRKAWGPRLSKQFIHSPCGTMFPRLVDVGEYLDAAQHRAAPAGRPPSPPTRR
jgi:hypothetical protein